MIEDSARLTIADPAPPRSARTRQESVADVPDEPTDHVWVGSAEVWVPQAWAEMHPLVGQLVSEDLTWRVGTLVWQSARPSRFTLRARAAWRAQGAALVAKRERLRTAALEFGFVAVPEPRPDRWWKTNPYFRFG